MADNYNFLYNDEITVLNLRKLYESCGFKKYRIGKFESYDFYAKNKDFLVSNRIITFSDLNGKLMALKPDVTLSIVKNADKISKGGRQKLYYTENVYRESKDIHEFKEIFQVGLEVLGEIDLFASAEIIALAVNSLLEIDPDALLDISHMGYIDGLLDCMTDNRSVRNEILELISRKNSHDLLKLSEKYALPANHVNTAIKLMSFTSCGKEAIEEAEQNALNGKMQDAVNELKNIYAILEKTGLCEHIRIDLSVSDDPGYYNGILMHGYVPGIARDVLSGGRYDMLMTKMGKKGTHAMGFAIYFDALDRRLHTRSQNSPECYIVYDSSSDIDKLMELTEKLKHEDRSYSAVNKLPEDAANAVVYTVCCNEIKEAKI